MRVHLAVCLLLGCTAGGSPPDASATKSPAKPGLRVSMTHHDDDGGRIEPSTGAPVLVFRADAPGMAELLAWGARGTSERYPESPPAVFSTPPHARATTDAEGVAHFELAAGDYVVTTPDSVLYESISVAEGRTTECEHSSGFRFATWTCTRPHAREPASSSSERP